MGFLGGVFLTLLISSVSLILQAADTNTALSFPTESVPTEIELTVEAKPPAKNPLSSLPSRIRAIPDILLRSSEYQQASLSSAPSVNSPTVNEPIEAVVNIFCTFTTAESIRTTTGTGFFIDPEGIIITNAHVAQFLLMEDTAAVGGDTECVVRAGNPAAPMYLAELLYISPAWIQANAGIFNEAIPMGTGERDYALLYVDTHVDEQALPAVFPALSFDSTLMLTSMRNATVTAAGYPATNLLENGPNADLFPQQADTSISELYTFGSNYADVFSIRGSEVGAEGASGGPVLNDAGEVIGMIVTRGDDTVDGAGSLRAITLSYIDRTIEEETGFALAENLGDDVANRAEVFRTTLNPFLESFLESTDGDEE